MSTTPPPSAPPPPGYQSGGYGGPLGPQLPALNGEFLFFVFVWAVVGIVTLAADTVAAGEFVVATVVLGSAYLISRGIAKAGKVHEAS